MGRKKPPEADPSRKGRASEPSPFALALGREIARLREARGMSRYELADAVGVRHPRVYEWERGERAPSGEYLALLLRALAVDVGPLAEVFALAQVRPPIGGRKRKSEKSE